MTIDALHITGCGNIVPGACDRDLALSLFLDPGSIAHQTAAQSSHHAYHTVGMDAGTTVHVTVAKIEMNRPRFPPEEQRKKDTIHTNRQQTSINTTKEV